MPIRRSPNGARHVRPQPGRNRPEWVVAINWNAWSQSVGTGGRNHPVRAAPAWLRSETKKWFLNVLADFELEESDIKLLTLAAEAFDRATQARETIAESGITYTDRLGNIRKHPAVSVEESARIAFARLVRELSISDSEPVESRPPNLRSNKGY